VFGFLCLLIPGQTGEALFFLLLNSISMPPNFRLCASAKFFVVYHAAEARWHNGLTK
jgi:hypothetical protein